MDKEIVKKFIDKNADFTIKNRAIGIYNSDAIRSYEIDTDYETARYSIKGTKLYKVVISDFRTKKIHIKCSCPYNWSPLCKHGLAALYHLQKNVNNQIISSKIIKANNLIKRKPSDPVEIFGAENLNMLSFNNYHLGNYYNRFNLSFTVKEISSTLLEFQAYSRGYLECKLFIEKKNKKYYIYSDASDSAKAYVKPHLFVTEYMLLDTIIDTHSNFLKIVFDKEEKKKFEIILAKDYGLEKQKNISQFFDIVPDLTTIFKGKLKEKYLGLIPIKESKRKETFDNFLQQISKKRDTKSLISSKNILSKPYILGFMISKERGNNNLDLEVNVTAVRGALQKNKSNLIKIKKYDSAFDFENTFVSDNQKKLLTKIKELEICVSEYNSDTDQYLFLLKEVMKLLKDEKFVFGRNNKNGYDYYYDRILKSELKPVSIKSDHIINLRFKVSKNSEIIQANTSFYCKDSLIDISKNKKELCGRYLFWINDTIYIAENDAVFRIYLNFGETPLSMLKSNEEEFIEKYVMPLSQNFDIDFDNDLKYKIEKIHLEPEKKQIFFEEEEDFFVLTPQVKYSDNKEIKLTDKQDIYIQKNFSISQYIRDVEFEDEYLEFLSTLHPDFEGQKEEGVFYIPIENMMDNMWFFNFYEQLKNKEVDVFGLKELKKFKYSPHKANIQTSISSGEDWFDVDVNVSFGNQTISLKDIKKAIKNKDKFVKLNDDSVGILPEEWLEKMTSYFRHGEIKGENLKVSKMKFSIIDELFEGIDQEEILEEIYKKKKLLRNFKKIDKIKIPTSLKANLRDYQKEGLNWLHFLNKMKWGGILADDMGLGKTIQMICLLLSVKSKKSNLIVVPTSLMFNWENELKKFAPSLKPFFYYGVKRIQDKSIFKENDLIITTYGIMSKDIKFLSSHTFNYIIIDESQAIKNPNSQRYKAAMLLKSKNKIALTGTPIENNTFDLFAQMNFVNPGFFGSIKAFKDNYSMPIDKDGDADIAEELQKLITPFLLRRTKEQVAKELPPKTEDVIYCEMPPQQRKIYDAHKNEYRNKILEKIESDGLNKSKLFVLAALTKLRQICDSPLLLKDKHIDTSESAKIKLLLEHINEKTSNHKILIFSQFTSMLALIRQQLESSNVIYEYLDGKSSTKNRQKSVDNFQKNKDVRVFLISLKAGGTGLNLTEADYVYIVDPWWNPAVENQAIDRCYRIGQDKKVMAYRLICKDTIEEKIIKLQDKKKKLAADIIHTDEKIMKTIDKSSLMDLFS